MHNVMGLDWKSISIALILLLAGKVLDKIIKDNLPNFHRKEVVARWKRRMSAMRQFFLKARIVLVAIGIFILLKLGQFGILKYNKKTMFYMLAVLILVVLSFAFSQILKKEQKSKA